jgi:hypothetical protein
MKRILFVALGLCSLAVPAFTTPAWAAPREDVIYGISRCGTIADDRTWLDCIYGAAQPMRAKLGLPPAPASQQALVPAIPAGQTAAMAAQSASNGVRVLTPDEAEYFSEYTKLSAVPRAVMRLFTPKEQKPEDPTTLTSYKFDAAGYFLVTLANGETWRQDNSDTKHARWNKPASSYTAQILPSGGSLTGRKLKVGQEIFQVNQVQTADAKAAARR